MKPKHILLAAVLVATLVAGTYTVSHSDRLQGSFGSGSGTWALSASSPSGSRTVSASDDVFAFDVTAPSTRSLTLDKGTALNFTFSSSTLDTSYTSGEGSRITLRDSSGVDIGHGYIETAEAGGRTDVYGSVSLLLSITMLASETETFTLTADSSALLDEDTGVDDELIVSMKVDRGIVSSVNLTGSTLQY